MSNIVRRVQWRRVQFGALLLSVVVTCAVNVGWAADSDEVVVGVFVPTTGALAPLGIEMRNGYQLAVDQHSEGQGRHVRLVVEDTQANASAGLRKAQKMVLQDEAKVLIGGASSSVVLGISAQSRRLRVPIVSTNSQAVQTTGEQCSRFLFRTNPNDAMVANATRQLMSDKPELLKKKWFVVYHDVVWGKSNKNEFEKIPALNVVGETGRPVGTADWASTISEIKASGADAIYLALLVGDDMPAFIRQARNYGLDQFMLPPLGMPDSMLQAIGDQAEGLITGGLFGSWMLEDGDPRMKSFVSAYVDKYGVVPGPQAIQGYAGMQLVLKALDSADSSNYDDVIAALESSSVDSILGKLAIRKEDHQGKVGTYMAEAVQLNKPEYGTTVAWKVLKKLSWDTIKTDLAESKCEGL